MTFVAKKRRLLPVVHPVLSEDWENHYANVENGKNTIKAWVKSVDSKIDREDIGKRLVISIIREYWKCFFPESNRKFRFTFPDSLSNGVISFPEYILGVCNSIGVFASKLTFIEANYLISDLYTGILSDEKRTQFGIYYTPPSLTASLFNELEKQCIDWKKSHFLDPACGGGAFLTPLAIRVAAEYENCDEIINAVENNIKGFEIDSFSGWLTQIFVEVALHKPLLQANRRLKNIVEIDDSLKPLSPSLFSRFDVIIGNPPYGKVKLIEERRKYFQDCLFGHANLYSLFFYQSINLLKQGGVLAFITPTGFLGGEYFKQLRRYLIEHTTPIKIDFITSRKDVFEGVLQETAITYFRKVQPLNSKSLTVESRKILTDGRLNHDIELIGRFNIKLGNSNPWIIGRDANSKKLISSISNFKFQLKDWGYKVVTGQLVWNRHKGQLFDSYRRNRFPIIWSESIKLNGDFEWTCDKANHKKFIELNDLPKERWLITDTPCVLLQRTTAKEQDKRLVAALLSEKLINEYKYVVVENHVNLIVRTNDSPLVPLKSVCAFFNSKFADQVFRCISGSVAVSAYELEAMPLPHPDKLFHFLD